MQADVVIASTLPVDLMSSDAWKRERTAGRNAPSEDRWKLSVSEISGWLETRGGETSLRLTTRLTSSYLVLPRFTHLASWNRWTGCEEETRD